MWTKAKRKEYNKKRKKEHKGYFKERIRVKRKTTNEWRIMTKRINITYNRFTRLTQEGFDSSDILYLYENNLIT